MMNSHATDVQGFSLRACPSRDAKCCCTLTTFLMYPVHFRSEKYNQTTRSAKASVSVFGLLQSCGNLSR